MSINITPRTDYSYLFNSLGTSNRTGSSMLDFNFSDYNSIKNGSYGKLLRAYYAKDSSATDSAAKSEDKKKASTSSETAVKELTAVSTEASALQTSAAKLINKGTDSLFKEKDITTTESDGTTSTVRGYDVNAIYDAANDFIQKYNSFIEKGADVSSSSINRETESLKSLVSNYKNSLGKAGITVNDDKTLSVDEKKFKASDITTLKSLFNGNTSFAYSVATKASLIGTNATSEANKAKNYTSSGSYSDTYSSGNLLNSII